MDLIRIGLIGASVSGGWAALAHVPAIHSLPEDLDFAAVCTAHRESAEASAKAFGARHAFWDYRDLVRSPDLDAVVVSVAVKDHREISLAAMREGKHVYCEWPLARTETEAQEMAAAARTSGVRAMAGLQGQSAPWCLRSKELLEEGYFGRLLHVNARFFGPQSARESGDIEAARRSDNTHILAIRGLHMMDMICATFGELRTVSAALGTQFPVWILPDGRCIEADAPDYMTLHATLTSGAVLSVHFACVEAFGSGWSLEVYGETAALQATSPGPGNRNENVVRLGRKGEPALQEIDIPDRLCRVKPGVATGAGLAVAHNYALFAQSIREGRTIGPDFECALRRYQMIRAIEESADNAGKSVQVTWDQG